ncbi:MAG: CDP-alcohol phosphatidyltransferase family protein [Ignavibacteriales bacterium]|nr:CDP-alcohol phosphatidyltransferase family protein [Ignavibacteriales bacterium]
MLNRIWTISTLLSFSRIVLIAPLAYFLFSHLPNGRTWVVAIIVVATITDFLDGYLARKLHQVSDFGKIVDPLADKICVGAVAVLLVVAGDLPLWYVVVVLVRDALILIGGIYIRNRKNIIVQSNWPGKIAVSLIALVLLLSSLKAPQAESFLQITIWLSVVLMVFSFIIYIQRLFIGSNAVKGNSV